MLFVFSGTGNSFAAAKRIRDSTGNRMVDIAAAVRYKRFDYDARGEDVGFVFPVYYYGLPRMVKEFVEKINLKNPGYVYGVLTCGGDSGGAAEMLEDGLKGHANLDACYDVFMPDNAIFCFDIVSKDEAMEILKGSDEELDSIISKIKDHSRGNQCTHSLKEYDWREMYPKYEEQRVTEPFHLNDKCIECRLCEEVCPEQIIKIYHRKPVWDEEKCSLCMSCIMLCPRQAIEYGDVTEGRNRYYNPIFYERVIGIPLKFE